MDDGWPGPDRDTSPLLPLPVMDYVDLGALTPPPKFSTILLDLALTVPIACGGAAANCDAD